jgi:hypothetical protein
MTDATKETAQPAAPSIELVDLQNAVKVIDYACEQGAFKGWQVIEQVIAVREKLANFLKAATPAAPEVTEAAPAAEVAPAPAAKKAAPKKSTTKK